MTSPTPEFPLSPSSRRALGWASAAAAHRANPPSTSILPVEPEDLLVGILLAQPDSNGEGRVFLEHFGLTARDVLPVTYPTISADDLARSVRGIGGSSLPPLSISASSILSTAQSLSRVGEIHLSHLLGGLLVATSELTTSLESAVSAVGGSLSLVAESYQRWLETDPGGTGIAGEKLRVWLRTENPRRPVDVPSYASDQVHADTDLIGIRREADALAYLIASRSLNPPLAIGLFGEWGSGKSFLMSALRYRIDMLAHLMEQTTPAKRPLWSHIKQIDFNAWEYVHGNLWAGLLARIFGELGTSDVKGLVEQRRAPVDRKITEQQKEIERLSRYLTELTKKEQEKQGVLTDARRKAQELRDMAEEQREALRAREVEGSVRSAVASVWRDQTAEILGASGVDLLTALTEARQELQRGRSLLGPYWRDPKHIALASLGALGIPLATLALEALHIPSVVSVLGGLSVAVPVVATWLKYATQWTRQRLNEIDEAEARVHAEVERRLAEADQKMADAQQALDAIQQQIAVAGHEHAQAQQHKQVLEEQLGELTPDRILVEFADERSSDYRRQLGLLATVRKDLHNLNEQVHENNLSDDADARHGMPNRIVLYIDDLDRCPPAKVVQVLEAVHLLLAFELFVVVVAVDSRWLSSALTEQLHALIPATSVISPVLPSAISQPTPKDYLEKIFQLPFWVRPLTSQARQRLVHGLLAGSVRADAGEAQEEVEDALHVSDREKELVEVMFARPGTSLLAETNQLALSSSDLTFLESLGPLLGDTPRRVKRFVNTCQLLLAMPPPLPADGSFPLERNVVCFLAAISEGLPALAEYLFDKIENRAIDTLHLAVEAASHLQNEREPMRSWLGQNPIWQTISLDSLSCRLDIVRRLRFDPPDTMR